MIVNILYVVLAFCVSILTFVGIIIFERLAHPKPKPIPLVPHNTTNNEPIGFDLNHKDWDDPEWEAPDWSKESQISNYILTPNEARYQNLEQLLCESSYKEAMILPSGIQIHPLIKSKE